MKISRRNMLITAGAGLATTASIPLVRAQDHKGHESSETSVGKTDPASPRHPAEKFAR